MSQDKPVLSREQIELMCEDAIGLDSNRTEPRWSRRKAEALRDLALSALDRQGWVSVPLEPTEEWVNAFDEASGYELLREEIKAGYRAAMLAAAPPASGPASGSPDEALALLREIDESGILFRTNLDLDAKVANFLNTLGERG